MALSVMRLVKLAVACLSLLTITGLYLQWTTRYRYHTTAQQNKQWRPLTNEFENDNHPKDKFNISLSHTGVSDIIITKNDRRNEKVGNSKIQYLVGLYPPSSRENGGEASNQNEERCNDVLCTQYLSGRDWKSFNVCRVRTSRKISVIQAIKELKVMIVTVLRVYDKHKLVTFTVFYALRHNYFGDSLVCADVIMHVCIFIYPHPR